MCPRGKFSNVTGSVECIPCIAVNSTLGSYAVMLIAFFVGDCL
jgi:hypothetical protein